MSDWSCRQREARSHLRLFHLVLGSHDGRALVPIPKRSAYPASDLDVVVVDSLKALDPNRPIREAGHRALTMPSQPATHVRFVPNCDIPRCENALGWPGNSTKSSAKSQSGNSETKKSLISMR